MENQNQKQTLSAKTRLLAAMIERDGWPVEWAGRDDDGKLHLQSNIFTVNVAPAPMFGQNIKAFGFDEATEIAEMEVVDDHDFGVCYMRQGSLRQEKDERWYVDLSVDPTRVRYVKVATMLQKEDGSPVLGEDGKPLIRIAPRKEGWITCELSQLEPVMDHAYHAQYVQSDRRNEALLRAAQKSEAASNRSTDGRKARRVKLSPRDLAAVQAKLLAES